MSDRGGGAFFAGLIVGALAGAAAALLLTPESGEELRSEIKDKGIELKSEAVRMADQVRAQAQYATQNVQEQISGLEEKGRIVLAENVKKAQQAVQQAQTKLSQQTEEAA